MAEMRTAPTATAPTATPTGPTAATPTAPTPDPRPRVGTTRREHHPDAPRLHDLVGDRSDYVNDGVYVRVVDRPAQQPVLDAITKRQPWADAEHLWHVALDGGLRSPAFRMVREGSTL